MVKTSHKIVFYLAMTATLWVVLGQYDAWCERQPEITQSQLKK